MKTVITIGREFASGGAGIAQKLAETLGIPFYDKKLIALAAEETGFSQEFIRSNDEKKTNSLLYDLYNTSQNLPINDQVLIAQFRLIKKLAEEGPCVIVGRCGNYVLREHPHALHVFIHAPMEERIRRAKEEYHITQANLESHIQRQDKARAAYYSLFATGKWSDPRNYHISLSSALGLERVVDLLANLAKSM